MNPRKKQSTEQRVPSGSLAPIPIVRALLLTLIHSEPESTGYDLMKKIAEFTEGRVSLKTGTVYSPLRRLELLGLVTTSLETGGRQKRSYRITAEGRKELDVLLGQIEHRMNIILKPLVRLARRTSSSRR